MSALDIPEHDSDAPVTVHEVARAAGVSSSTVSRILNGTAKVSEPKRRAVEEAVARMGYKPNLLAQGLKNGRAMTIGVLVPDVASSFFVECLRGIEATLQGTGYASLIVSGHWNAAEEAEKIELLIARRVDGILIASGHLSDTQIMEFSRRVPIVATGHDFKCKQGLGISLEQAGGARDAIEYLVELGHRRIAFIAGPKDHTDAQLRFSGYQQALESAGIGYDPGLVVDGNFRESGGLLAIDHLFAQRMQFTAIFAANDESAYGARLGLYRRGIRVPDDISIVGFDDLPGSSYTTPPLTTVRQPIYELGKLLSTCLLDATAGKPIEIVVPATKLVIRESARRAS